MHRRVTVGLKRLRSRKPSNEEALAGDGPGVEAGPGEEEEDQETLRSRRDGQ